MPVDEVRGPTPQPARASDPAPVVKATSSGISAVAIKDGTPVSIFTDHWQPVSEGAPELKGVPLSSLTEWTWVNGGAMGGAWRLDSDPHKADVAGLQDGHLQAFGKNLPIIAVDRQPVESAQDRDNRLATLPPGAHEFTVLDGARALIVQRSVGTAQDRPELADINNGHLHAFGKNLPILAVDHQEMAGAADRDRRLAALIPGLHVFTVLDGAKMIDLERTVGSPQPQQPQAPTAVAADVPKPPTATRPHPGREASGIHSEAVAFKGPKAVGATAQHVLMEMANSPDHDAWQEQFVPLLGQVRDHQRLAVPHPLIEKVVARVAKQSPETIHKYGRRHVEVAVRQFIEGAARRIYAGAGRE